MFQLFQLKFHHYITIHLNYFHPMVYQLTLKKKQQNIFKEFKERFI
jgi:hypothetical protein